jgi:hypothetical protein
MFRCQSSYNDILTVNEGFLTINISNTIVITAQIHPIYRAGLLQLQSLLDSDGHPSIHTDQGIFTKINSEAVLQIYAEHYNKPVGDPEVVYFLGIRVGWFGDSLVVVLTLEQVRSVLSILLGPGT